MTKIFINDQKLNEVSKKVFQSVIESMTYFHENIPEAELKDFKATELFMFLLFHGFKTSEGLLSVKGADQEDIKLLLGALIIRFENYANTLTKDNRKDFWSLELKKRMMEYQGNFNQGVEQLIKQAMANSTSLFKYPDSEKLFQKTLFFLGESLKQI